MGEEQKKVWPKIKAKYEALRTNCKQQSDGCLQDVFANMSMPHIVEVQRNFQAKCKPSNLSWLFEYQDVKPGEPLTLPRAGKEAWREKIRTHILAAIAEMTECLETCPWKPWKDQGDHAEGSIMSEEKLWEARLEVVDAFCFLMNVWLLLGGDGVELANLYLAKMGENHRRQREGY